MIGQLIERIKEGIAHQARSEGLQQGRKPGHPEWRRPLLSKARLAFLATVLVIFASPACGEPPEVSPKMNLIREIQSMFRDTAGHTGRSAMSPRVLAAMEAVPREKFVHPGDQDSAYRNRPLPIGGGQTISQPYIVALMTELLDLERDHKVLEVGTGSGYQAAVLGELCDAVFTVEIVPELARSSAKLLEELGYDHVHTRLGDGYHGWPEEAPFDAVIVTAAAPEIPQPLLDQLAPGGRMVIPVKKGPMSEDLVLVVRQKDGFETRDVLPVRFVPLTREP